MLGGALAGEAVTAAPAGLGLAIAGTALAGAAAGGGTAVTALKIMTITKLKIGIIGALAVAGLAAPLVVQNQALTRLRKENDSLREQQAQVTQLTAENERLSGMLSKSNAAGGLPDDQLRELMRLRGEVGELRREGQEVVRLQAENQRLRTQVSSVQAQGEALRMNAATSLAVSQLNA